MHEILGRHSFSPANPEELVARIKRKTGIKTHVP